MPRCHWSRSAAQVRAVAVATAAYQAIVTPCAVAGGSTRILLVTGANQAHVMTMKLTGAAMIPLRSAYRDRSTHAAAAMAITHHPVSWAISG